MPIRIVGTDLNVSREPLLHPFRFKGSAFTEKWLCRVTLRSDSGATATGLGGLSVLWSDAAVFHAHTEVGGNLVMAAMLEQALMLVRGQAFDTPLDLLDAVIEPVYEYGRRITGKPELRRTFALNSLVGLDNAAWRLYARETATRDFEALLPETLRSPVSHRNAALAMAPMVGYRLGIEAVVDLVRSGYFVLKIKIGAPGEPEQMLADDMQRLSRIHEALARVTTPHTPDGRVRLYLDANARYPEPDLMKRLLRHLRHTGMIEQVILLEEPYPEATAFDVRALDVRVAADESLHDVEDVGRKAQLGYGAVALKPAGKTLSVTLRVAAEADRRGVPCFVADSGCVPELVQWNKNVAARLKPFPGLETNLMESNGAQHYTNWRALMDAHPCHGADWLEPRNGLFHLDADFYRSSGGIFQ